MATPNATAEELQVRAEFDLMDELSRAERELAQGDFIELTVEDLDRCIVAGEWPWPNGSSE